MATRWPPTKDAELANYLTAFSAAITAAPTDYGLTAADATALAAAVTAFVNALALAVDPTTRTPSTVANKDITKATAVATLRADAKRIQSNPAVTPQQKIDLGLPVHKATPTVIPPPVTRPVISAVGGSVGRSLTIRLADETTPTKRGKPFGVDGAEVYSYVPAADETPPEDLEQWRFEGIAKKATFDIGYNAGDVGKTTTIRALWFNPRGEPGPASAPITATVAA